MAKYILVDEFHVTVAAPRNLPEVDFISIRKMLDAARFGADLRRQIRNVFRRYPELLKVRLSITR